MKKRISINKKTQAGVPILLVAGAAVLLMPEQAAKGTAAGLELCISVVIPSLFMLMFVSIAVVETGAAERAGQWLSPFTRRVFGLPGAAGAALLLAVTGGYPAGAKAVRGLYERGAVTSDEASRMSCFCFCAGPAFLLSTVGVMIMSDVSAGLLLLGVQLAVVPLIGLADHWLFSRGRRANKSGDQPPLAPLSAPVDRPRCDVCSAVVSSARQTASALLSVCLFVIIFCAVREMLGSGVSPALCHFMKNLGISESVAAAVVPILLEVTGGCAAAAPCGLPAVAFAAGFGGISVHMQVFSILGSECVRKGRFFVMRLIQGVVSWLLTALLLRCIPGKVFAASAPLQVSAALSGSVTGAATLLLMCVMCLLCLPDTQPQRTCRAQL